jgi:hypothetical protein
VPALDVGAWNVPEDMLATVHKGEIVIPANFAEGIRGSGFVKNLAAASEPTIPKFDVGAWNVPEDMLATVHKGEIVIPTSFAEGVRSAAASVPKFDAGAWRLPGDAAAIVNKSEAASRREEVSAGDVHLHVHAIDAAGVRKWMEDNGEHIAAALKKQSRNFHPAFS